MKTLDGIYLIASGNPVISAQKHFYRLALPPWQT
jgi:hypothetical protein